MEQDRKRYIRVRFRNEEDLKQFAELLNRPNLSNKTKRIDYPLIPKDKNTLENFFE